VQAVCGQAQPSGCGFGGRPEHDSVWLNEEASTHFGCDPSGGNVKPDGNRKAIAAIG